MAQGIRKISPPKEAALVLDPDHYTILEADRGVEDVFGLSSQQLLGREFSDLVSPAVQKDLLGELEAFRQLIQDDLSRNERIPPLILELPGKRLDHDFDMSVRFEIALAQQSIAQRAFEIIARVRDITERRRREELLDAMMKAFPDRIYLMARDGTYVNFRPAPGYEDISSQNLVGKNIADRMPTGLAGKVIQKIVTALETHKLQIESYDLPFEGMNYSYETRIIPYDKDKVLCLVRDITDQKQAEQKLIASEELYRELLANLPVIVYQTTQDGTFLTISAAAREKLGYAPDELLAGNMTNLYTDPARRQQCLDKLHREGVLQNEQLELHDHQGKVRIFLDNVHAVADPKDPERVIRYDGTLTDVTELRRAEEQFETLFEQASDGIAILGSSDVFLNVNQSMCKILGSDKEAILKESALSFLSEEKRALFSQEYTQMQAGKTLVIETRIIRRDQSFLSVEFSAKKLNDGRILVIVRDISRRKQMEEHLRQSNQELQEFAETVAHQFKNPLTLVKAYGELLEERLKDDPVAISFLQQVQGAAVKIQKFMEAILGYARDSQRPVEQQAVPVCDLVDKVLQDFHLEIEQKQFLIQTGFQGHPVLLGDRILIEQILHNYISNALKYGSGVEKVIEIGAEEVEGDQILLWVQDTGDGLTQEDMNKLFERFKRLDKNKKKADGNGLGLAKVKKWTERMGGSIGVEQARWSDPNRPGTRFFIILPKAKEIPPESSDAAVVG